jgi:hypothetical protein
MEEIAMGAGHKDWYKSLRILIPAAEASPIHSSVFIIIFTIIKYYILLSSIIITKTHNCTL